MASKNGLLIKKDYQSKVRRLFRHSSESGAGLIDNKMHCIYILNSIPFSNKFYVGYTTDVHGRLQAHNAGNSLHTKEYKPWKLIWYCAFESKDKALEFEKYLKSHSGRAFAKKRLG